MALVHQLDEVCVAFFVYHMDSRFKVISLFSVLRNMTVQTVSAVAVMCALLRKHADILPDIVLYSVLTCRNIAQCPHTCFLLVLDIVSNHLRSAVN